MHCCSLDDLIDLIKIYDWYDVRSKCTDSYLRTSLPSYKGILLLLWRKLIIINVTLLKKNWIFNNIWLYICTNRAIVLLYKYCKASGSVCFKVSSTGCLMISGKINFVSIHLSFGSSKYIVFHFYCKQFTGGCYL